MFDVRSSVFGLLLIAMFLTSGAHPLPAANIAVTNTLYSQLQDSEFTFFRGEVPLPADIPWDISITGTTDVVQFYVLPPENARDIPPSRRMPSIETDRQLRRGRDLVIQLLWPCQEYAEQHDHQGPATVNDLDATRYPYILDNVRRSPYGNGAIDGPFVFLVPNAAFPTFTRGDIPDDTNRQVLVVELRPYLDDGRHWVLYADGTCNREPINSTFMAAHKLTLRPVTQRPAGQPVPDASPEQPWRLLAIRRHGIPTPLKLVASGQGTAQKLNLSWDFQSSKPDDKRITDDLRVARIRTWQACATRSDSPVLRHWLTLYGTKPPSSPAVAHRTEIAPSASTLFGGLGILLSFTPPPPTLSLSDESAAQSTLSV